MKKMNIEVMKCSNEASLPYRAHSSDAGLDLCALQGGMIEPGGRKDFGTGIAVKIPEGSAGLVLNRSGLNFKRNITSAVGVIDAGYTGEIHVMLENHDQSTPAKIYAGDRIAQLVIVPCALGDVEEVFSMEETERGTDGFGSTDGVGHYKIVED